MNRSAGGPVRAAPILNDPARLPARLAGPVLAIGNFDGVHRGHRAVLARARDLGERIGAPVVALTFEPHPRRFFRPSEPLFLLTPEPLRARLLALTGLDGVAVLPFDQALASTSAEDFIADLIVGRFGARGVVVGWDFHFGRGRGGSPATLVEAGAGHDFAVEVAPPHGLADVPVSASLIRARLERGEVAEAAALLGFPWTVRALVSHGDKRGRQLGFPTANLPLSPDCGLAHGIYAVRAAVAGQLLDGVASYGRRPTFDDGAPLFEVFLLDFAGDLYGLPMLVELVDHIRGEEKFASIEALIARMAADCRQARDRLAAQRPGFPASLLLGLAEFETD